MRERDVHAALGRGEDFPEELVAGRGTAGDIGRTPHQQVQRKAPGERPADPVGLFLSWSVELHQYQQVYVKQEAMRRTVERLLRRLGRGDREAAIALVDGHYQLVYWYLLGLCRDGERAADLTQQKAELSPEAEPTSFEQYDRRTVVTWDTGSGELRGLERYVQYRGQEVLVARLRVISHIDLLADSIFTLAIPWIVH